MQLEDGTGSGSRVAINSNNQLKTISVIIPDLSYHSVKHSDTYSWTAVTADLAAGDTALLVSNDSQTKNLHIDYVYIWADVPTAIKLHFPAYVTPAGTAVLGVNWNRKSGKLADATAKAGETANVFSQANVFYTIRSNEDTNDQFGNTVCLCGAVILGYHTSIAVDIIADSAAFQCTIIGHYVDISEE
jgi:hypothetical protein